MDVGMHLGQSQRLEQNISPQMLQSIAILQKNSLELETAIKAEVEANPSFPNLMTYLVQHFNSIIF